MTDSLADVRGFIERARERQADNRSGGELHFGHGASILYASTMMDVVERCERAERALHARFACPGWEYATTAGPRKQWDDQNTPPAGDGWERNTDFGRGGWDRFDYTEQSYWRRPIPQRERLVHDDAVLAEQIREGVAEAERGETVDLGSFAQHLEVDDRLPPGLIAMATPGHVIAHNTRTGGMTETRQDEHRQWSAPAPVVRGDDA